VCIHRTDSQGSSSAKLLSKHTTFVNKVLAFDFGRLLDVSREMESALTKLHAQMLLERILAWSHCFPLQINSIQPTRNLLSVLRMTVLRISCLKLSQTKPTSMTISRSLSSLDSPLKLVLAHGLQNGSGMIEGHEDHFWGYMFYKSFTTLKLAVPRTDQEEIPLLSNEIIELARSLMQFSITHLGSVCTPRNFHLLAGLLRSKCVPIREVALHLAARIITRWSAGLSGTVPLTAPATYLFNLVTLSSMHIQLRADLQKRIQTEGHQRRLCFSTFVTTGIEFLSKFYHLEKKIIRRKNGLPARNTFLHKPLIKFATKDSLHVTWLASGKQAPMMYKLELADPLCGVPEHLLQFRVVHRGAHASALVNGLSPSRTYLFRVVIEDVSSELYSPHFLVSPIAALQTKKAPAFTFDHTRKGPAIKLSTNALGAIFEANETWATVLGSSPFMSQCNSWEFEIINSSSLFLFVGVASLEANLTTFLGGDEHSWGYIGDRALYHRRMKSRLYGERFGHGDTVGVILNMDYGSLSFSKNGMDLGVAFNGLIGELYPAVAFYNQGQHVALIEHAFKCPGAGEILASSPFSFNIDQACESFDLMSSMTDDLPLSDNSFRRLHNLRDLWLRGSARRVKTCFGFEVTISSHVDPSLHTANGQYVHTPRGNAFVLGSAFGLTWFDSGKNVGAYFYTSAAVRREISNGHFQIVPCSGNANNTTPSCRLHSGTEDDPPTQVRENLRKVLADKKMHHSVIREINEVTQSSKKTSWNIEPTLLLEHLRTPRADRNIKSFYEFAGTHVALVLLLNDDILRGFRYFIADLEHAFWYEGNPQSSPVSGNYISTSLFKFRNSILKETKHRLFQIFAEQTATKAKQAEDDYDYPDDLTQVVLNRFKASTALGTSQCKVLVFTLSAMISSSRKDSVCRFLDSCLAICISFAQGSCGWGIHIQWTTGKKELSR